MKKKLAIILSGVALLASLVFAAGCAPTSAQTTTPVISTQQQGIWVSGTGKVTVTPDIANVSLGIQAQDSTVQAAQAKATQAMNAVMDALAANNIAQKDIKTQYFNISQMTRWDNSTNQPVVTGYQVSNSVTVKIRDINAVGKVFDDVVNAGGDFTRVNGISFSVDNPDQYYQEARQKAMEDAKTTAEQLASAGGVTLGQITYISTGSQSVVPPPVMYSTREASGGASTPISVGETDIVINVQVIYSIS